MWVCLQYITTPSITCQTLEGHYLFPSNQMHGCHVIILYFMKRVTVT